MAGCPNFRSPEWIALQNKIGMFEAFREYLKNGEQVPDASKYEETFKGVNATMKVAEALTNPKIQQFFTSQYLKGNKDKFFAEVAQLAGKQQTDLLRDMDNNFESINDMIANLLSEMSYTVEIKTSTKGGEQYDPYGRNIIMDAEGNQYELHYLQYMNNEGEIDENVAYTKNGKEISLEEFNKVSFIKETADTPTSYYSSLTLPGGTNYKENEIATPAIVPSIKGHAQFATQNGIGWFRADEAIARKEKIENPKDYWIDEVPNEFHQTDKVLRKTRDIPSKTLRILEVQSDLFQKGRDKARLTGQDRTDNEFDVMQDSGFLKESGVLDFDYDSKLEKIQKADDNNNNFLQLLNKDNNWVKFFVKSIVQDSAKKGYEQVLFPAGDTAAKVEGHEDLKSFVRNREQRLKNIDENIRKFQDIQNIKEQVDYEREQGDFGGEEMPEPDYEKAQKSILERKQIEKEQLELDIEQANSGTMKLSSIANFYETTIQNILKKQGYKPERITDEYGNDWFQVDLSKNKEELVSFDISLPYTKAREQFVDRWKLKGIVKEGEFGYVSQSGKATLALAKAMAKQMSEKSGEIYDNLNIRYNSTYGLIQISPVIKRDLFNSEPSYDINTGQRKEDIKPLPVDFTKIPSGVKLAFVISGEGKYKYNTFVKNGEYFNVERLRGGTAAEIAKTQRIDIKTLKDRIKYSNLKAEIIEDFFSGKSRRTMYLYKVNKVDDPKDFINPDQDSSIDKFIKAKESQAEELLQRARQVTDKKEQAEIYKEKNRIDAQRKAALKSSNQNTGFLKNSFEEDKDFFNSRSFNNKKDLDFELRRFQGYKIIFDTVDKNAFGPEVKAEFDQIYKDIDDIEKQIHEKSQTVIVKNMEFKAKITLTDEDGNLLPIKDIGRFQELLLSTSDSSNNPLVRYITQRSYYEITRAKDRTNAKGKDIKKATEELIKFSKGLGITGVDVYNYLLEEETDGKPNGHFVIHYGRFYSDFAKVMKKGKGELSDMKDFLDFLNKNTKALDYNKEGFQKDFQSIYDKEYDKAIKNGETEQAAQDIAVKQASNISYSLNPENFEKVLNKFRTSNELNEKEAKLVKSFIDKGAFHDYVKVTPKDEFIDKKYAAIDKLPDTHPQKVFYKLFSELHYEVNKRVRVESAATQRRNFIAEFKRDYKDKDQSLGDYLKQDIHDKIVDLFTESPNENIQGVDPITGQILRMIPFYSLDGRIAADKKNYNLGKVAINLAKEFYKFEALSDLEDDLLAAEYILKNTKTFKTNAIGGIIPGPNEEPLLNDETSAISKQVDHKILSTLYNERMKKEGVGDKNYFDWQIKQRMEQLEALPELDADQAKEYSELKKTAKRVTGKKTANALINFTSIRNIAFNLFSGIGEFAQANASLYLRYGTKTWFNSVMQNTIALYNPIDSAKKNKLKGLADIFGVRGDTNSEMKDTTFKKVSYATFKPARDIGNTAYLVAVLKDQIIKDKEGVEHPLFDVMDIDDNGKIVLPENFENPFYTEKGEFTKYKYDLNQIVAKEIRNNRDRENDIDPIKANQYAAGRLLGQFKASWLFQGFNTRFSVEKEGLNDLDSKSKGIYRSLWDLSKKTNLITDADGETREELSMPKTLGNVLINILKYSALGRATKFGKQSSESDLDYEGAIRAVREVQTAMFLYGVVLVLGAAKGDGDEDKLKKYFRTFAINAFMRNQRDMTTYFDPNSLTSIVNKGIIPSLSTLSDTWKLIQDPFHGVFSNKWYYNEGQDNQQLRITRDAEDMLPLLNQIRRTFNKIDKNQSIFYNSQF